MIEGWADVPRAPLVCRELLTWRAGPDEIEMFEGYRSASAQVRPDEFKLVVWLWVDVDADNIVASKP